MSTKMILSIFIMCIIFSIIGGLLYLRYITQQSPSIIRIGYDEKMTKKQDSKINGEKLDIISTTEIINKEVGLIQERISKKELPFMEVNNTITSEGVPPAFKFYYQEDRLIAALIDVGHETWSTHFSYFFYENGNLMKFIKKINDREPNEPIQGIIYNRNGKILWSNIDGLPVNPIQIQELFSDINKIGSGFSLY